MYVEAGLVFYESVFSFYGASFSDMEVGVGVLCFYVFLSAGKC